MTLEALKIFCDVVRQRSFSRAASINQVSQSAASQAVLQIEKRLGVRLIDRSRRPIGLTLEGRLYYEGCRDLLDRYLAVEAQTQAMHAEASSRINVAAIYSLVLYNLGQYVDRFLARHSRGNVRIDYLHPDQVYNSVLNEEADLGLISFARSSRQLYVIPWQREPMVLVCHPRHPFVAAGQVTAEQLNGQNFVGFDAGLAIRRAIDRYLRRHGIEVNLVMAFDNIEAIKRGVETAAGVSILPRPTVRREVAAGSLAVVRLVGLDLVRPLSIILRRGRPLTLGISDFIELLKQTPSHQESEATVERRQNAQPGRDEPIAAPKATNDA
ncbi:MAG: LysR family transcriptional regulator [Phycisphaerae bacterium]